MPEAKLVLMVVLLRPSPLTITPEAVIGVRLDKTLYVPAGKKIGAPDMLAAAIALLMAVVSSKEPFPTAPKSVLTLIHGVMVTLFLAIVPKTSSRCAGVDVPTPRRAFV